MSGPSFGATVGVGTGFRFQDRDDTSGSYVYVGYENANGSWFIERRTLGSYLWENVAGGSGYASAWADREILVYV